MLTSTQEQAVFHLSKQQDKFIKCFLWILVIVCMGLIFYFSSRTSTESTNQSTNVLSFFEKLFGIEISSDFLIRKLAHFFEYTGLSFLFNLTLAYQNKKPFIISSVVFSSLYAVTDEVHQIFVSGRSCQIKDWAIDTSGAILGSVVFIILFLILKKLHKIINKKCHND